MEEEKKPLVTVDQDFKSYSGGKKARIIIGSVCFILAGVLVLFHLGFVRDSGSGNIAIKHFLNREELWYINLGLGLVGGILLAYKQALIAAVSGVLAAAAITGSALLYFGWRDTVYQFELLFPLMTGLLGIVLFKSLSRNR